MINKLMIASGEEITDGQIESILAKLRDALHKNRRYIRKSAAQSVLGVPNLGIDLYALVRAYLETFGGMVTRQAIVDRTRTAKAAMLATRRVPYLSDNVLSTVPICVGDIETIFVNLGRNVDCDKLDDELAKLGLELIVDPVGLAAINEAEPTFADKYPNGTQWKDAHGKYCYAIFSYWNDERHVDVFRNDIFWNDRWWFPCRCKEELSA